MIKYFDYTALHLFCTHVPVLNPKLKRVYEALLMFFYDFKKLVEEDFAQM